MGTEDNAYEKVRRRLLNALFGHPWFGPLLATVVLILVAGSFLLDFFEKAEKRFTPSSRLEVVDIRAVKTEGFPILDIKLRNTGSSVLFLKAIDFEVLEADPEIAEPHMSAGVPVSEQYNVLLDPVSQNYRVQLPVSQEIPGNGTDRINVIVGAFPGAPKTDLSASRIPEQRGAETNFSSFTPFLHSTHLHSSLMRLQLKFHYNETDFVISSPFEVKVIVHDYFEKPEQLIGMTFNERVEALEKGSLSTRADMARILGDTGDRRAIPYLIQALNQEDDRVVALSALSLGKLRALNALPAFEKLLSRSFSSNRPRWRVAQGIGLLGDPAGAALLKDMYAESDFFVRRYIHESLRQLGETDLSELYPFAIHALEVESGPTRDVVNALVEIGDRRAIPSLRTAYCKRTIYSDHKTSIRYALRELGETDLSDLVCPSQ